MLGLLECSSGIIITTDMWQIEFTMKIVEGYVGVQFSNIGRLALF